MGKAQEILAREENRLEQKERQVVIELRTALRAKFITEKRIAALMSRVDDELEGRADVKITPKILDLIFREAGKDSDGGDGPRTAHVHIHNLPEQQLRQFAATGILSLQQPQKLAQKIIDAKPLPEKPKEKPPPIDKDPDLVY